jgi:hypothetical protein
VVDVRVDDDRGLPGSLPCGSRSGCWADSRWWSTVASCRGPPGRAGIRRRWSRCWRWRKGGGCTESKCSRCCGPTWGRTRRRRGCTRRRTMRGRRSGSTTRSCSRMKPSRSFPTPKSSAMSARSKQRPAPVPSKTLWRVTGASCSPTTGTRSGRSFRVSACSCAIASCFGWRSDGTSSSRSTRPTKKHTSEDGASPARAPRHSDLASQAIHFCSTPDGVRLAYGVSGQGPPLVKASNWLTHLDYDWESPVWRHWWRGLSQRHTLIRYDERGCGLSDWGRQRLQP